MSELPKTTLAGKILTQCIGLLFFVGVPCLATAIAPVSWLNYSRSSQGVRLVARTCLLFVVPFKTQIVDPLTTIEQDFKQGSQVGRRGEDRFKYSEDEAFLLASNANQKAKISVSPVDIDEVIDKSRDFLQDSTATEERIFVVANWKFSVIMGGCLSLLTVFYVVSILVGLTIMAARHLKTPRH